MRQKDQSFLHLMTTVTIEYGNGDQLSLIHGGLHQVMKIVGAHF